MTVNKIGVLIVEDSGDIAELIRDGIQGTFPSYIAEDGYKAIEILKAKGEEIFVVILDIAMPRMDGFQFLKHIVNTLPFHIGVVFVSGLMAKEIIDASTRDIKDEHIMLGKYFGKPFDPIELFEEIELTVRLVMAKRKLGTDLILGKAADSLRQVGNTIETIGKKIPSDQNIKNIVEETIRLNLQTIMKYHFRALEQSLMDKLGRKKNLLEELGFELLKAIVIAAAFVALLLCGVEGLLRRLFHLSLQ